MSDLTRRLSRIEQAATKGEDASRAATCRAAAQTYLDLLHALRPDYKLPTPLPPPSLPVARARAAFAALMTAIAEQEQEQEQSKGGATDRSDQP